jgi:hypothetical protein
MEKRNSLFLDAVKQSKMMASDVNSGLAGGERMMACAAFIWAPYAINLLTQLSVLVSDLLKQLHLPSMFSNN